MPIDSVFTREQRAVREVTQAATHLRHLIEDTSAPSLVHFYDHFVGAVAEFGVADMASRESGRLEAAGLQKDQLRSLGLKGDDHNARGLDGLAAAERHLIRFREEVDTFAKRNPKLPADLAKRADDLHSRVKEELASLEIKDSDVVKLTAAIAPCFELARAGEVGRLPQFLTEQVGRLAGVRKEPERGRQENFPFWKIIGWVVAFGVFIWAFVQCGFFGCSLDIAGLMAVIGFWAVVLILLC